MFTWKPLGAASVVSPARQRFRSACDRKAFPAWACTPRHERPRWKRWFEHPHRVARNSEESRAKRDREDARAGVGARVVRPSEARPLTADRRRYQQFAVCGARGGRRRCHQESPHSLRAWRCADHGRSPWIAVSLIERVLVTSAKRAGVAGTVPAQLRDGARPLSDVGPGSRGGHSAARGQVRLTDDHPRAPTKCVALDSCRGDRQVALPDSRWDKMGLWGAGL